MLGSTLKLIRIANELSLNKVSRKLNLRISLIKRIERNETKISLNTLYKFASFYQIPISKILILNDFQEHFNMTNERILEDIKNYYSCINEDNEFTDKIKIK